MINARRLIPSILATAFGVMAFASASALAAAPEPPEVSVETPVHATTATFHGVVNPKAALFPVEAGTYQFAYRPSTKAEDKCKGSGETLVPASAGMYFGLAPESFSETATPLTANTEYAVCMVVEDKAGKTASAPVPFTTALPPETPETGKAKPIAATTATLHGVLNPGNPGNPGTYEFVYRPSGASPTECQGEGEAATPAEHAAGTKQEAVKAEPAGLLPNTQYTFCLRARNEAGEEALGAPQTFTTSPEAPLVSGESFSDVGSGSVNLRAEVNPGGLPTTYTVEYGATTAYGSSTPPGSLPNASEAVAVSTTLNALQPGTLYHFRVSASNTDGTEHGQDTTFTTLPAGVLGLPDGRVYEMVTPPNNYNANVYSVYPGTFAQRGEGETSTLTELPFQAAADGGAVAYVASPTTGGNGNAGTSDGNEYIATRSLSGGWTQVTIQPPEFFSPEYEAFSTDLSTGVLCSNESLVAGAPAVNSLYTRISSDSSYHPLFTNVPTNRAYLESYNINVENGSRGRCSLTFAGASADFHHVLFPANGKLTGNAPEGGEQENNLYDSVGGNLQLVNVLPDGSSVANATFGAPRLASSPPGAPQMPDFSHVISADGSRVFWTSLNSEGQPNALYVRENDAQPQSPLGKKGECTVDADACTVQIDLSHGPGASGGGRFWTATASGSIVFFTDESQLTTDSTAAPGEPDLYEYEVASGRLTDLTVDTNAGEHANVQGVLGASETDGSYVYFVASGRLASGAEPQQCTTTECNLYVLHRGEGPKLIATLAAGGGGGAPAAVSDWSVNLNDRGAEATPDGGHLVFTSGQALTGPGSEGVYLYDAETQALTCVSCLRSGEPSTGGYLPASASDTHLPRWVSNDGSRVLFDDAQALVPQDVNDLQDVYEWERDGAGGCREAAGCQYLLSGGTSQSASMFVDASASGNDVFFNTRAQLVPQDGNDNFDLYDARVGGVRPVSAPACTGTGCQGLPPAPPVFATPSSVTFNGVGNFPPPVTVKSKSKSKLPHCGKRLVKRKNKCVKQAKPKKARKSSRDRRGK